MACASPRILVTLGALIFIGCSQPDAPIVGKWRATLELRTGEVRPDPNRPDSPESFVEFKPDESLVIIEDGKEKPGTWKIDGTKKGRRIKIDVARLIGTTLRAETWDMAFDDDSGRRAMVSRPEGVYRFLRSQ